jgi:multidrug efflux system membrane fusion protein
MSVAHKKSSGVRSILWLLLVAAIVAAAWIAWPLQRAQALWLRAASIVNADLASGIGGPEAGHLTGHRTLPRHKGAIAQGDGAIPVIAATAHAGDIPIDLNALGTVTALATVTVRPQLSGYLTQVGFTEGQMVKRGDFLAQIDPRPYQIALEQAQGQLAHDQALLRDANIDLGRYKKLASEDSIARQQVDSQQSLVQQDQGTILSDQAQIDSAKLNLDYCHITAPVSGRIGLRQVDPGNYVQAGEATVGLAVIAQLQPISVLFTIPEDDIPMVQARLRAGASLSVMVYDRSRSTTLATGMLTTIDNQIDSGTGTVKLRAQLDNADLALFPNQFVNVTLQIAVQHDDVVVPSAALQHGPAGAFVYLVKPDGSVAQQAVTTGQSSGDDVAILSGLAVNDQVVVDGVDQLRDGSKVTVTKLAATGPAAGAGPDSDLANATLPQ